MSGSEKIANRNTSNKIFGEHMRHFFSIKCVTRKFHVVVVQNNGKEMYLKSVLHLDYYFFCTVLFVAVAI